MVCKHQAAEAFNLMSYKCQGCGKKERLWNSRDGVTPYVIQCGTCKGEMSHVDWGRDVYAPSHKTQPGERIFVDLTIEVARLGRTAYVEQHWRNAEFPLSEKYASKEEAVDKLSARDVADWGGHNPHVITVV